MGSKRLFGFLFMMIFLKFTGVSEAYKFFVGGKDGWVLNPHENFNHWAERNRFEVNDTLSFKFKEGSDSVLVVNRDDYNSCNTTKPMMSLTNGGSVFTFDRSGPFFFISGNAQNCQKGQKLTVVVLAVRNKRHCSPPTPSPASSVVLLPPLPPSTAPEAESPVPESPESKDNSPEFDTPAPAPNGNSGTSCIGSFVLLLCVSVGVSVVLG